MIRTLLTFLILFTLSIASQGKSLVQHPSGVANLLSSLENLNNALGEDPVKVVFYPNPVKDFISVKYSVKGDHKVIVYSIIGEKLAEKTGLDCEVVKLDLTDLQKGMYFISYELAPGKAVTKTFTKE